MAEPEGDGPRQVHPMVVLLAGYGWRLLVLGAVVVATYWVLAELWATATGERLSMNLCASLRASASSWSPGTAALSNPARTPSAASKGSAE